MPLLHSSPIAVDVLEGRGISVAAGFRDKEDVKLIPGARWRDDVWSVPMSWAALQQLRGVFDERLVIGDQLAQLSWTVWKNRVEPCLALRAAGDAPWVEDPRLTPLQRAGAAFLATARQGLEADPMGSGKTPMTITALKYLQDPYPALVVCPNGVKPHWRNEYLTWNPDVAVSVVQGTAAQRRKALDRVASGEAQVAAINWESLAKHSRLAGFGSIRLSDKEKEPKELNEIGFRTVIGDEIHRAKDPKAKQTRALWAVGDAAEYRFGLTGTPIANTPADLWAIMRFIAPDEYPTKSTFIDRYALLSWSPSGYMDIIGLRGEHKEELYRFLDPRMIRRPKEIILPDLKGKLPTVRRVVDLHPKQRKAYKQMQDELIVQLDNGVLMASNPLQLMGRLRQLTGATGTFAEPESEGAEPELILKEPSSKIDDLMDVLDELGDDQAIVFADSRKLLELAAARLSKHDVPCVLYTGKVSEDERESNRVAFVEGRTRCILGTYGAMAEGVNLATQSSAATIKLEKSWSSIKDTQAEERGVRPGMGEPMRVIEIFAHETVDERVAQAVADKLGMLEEVVRDEATLRSWLDCKP